MCPTTVIMSLSMVIIGSSVAINKGSVMIMPVTVPINKESVFPESGKRPERGVFVLDEVALSQSVPHACATMNHPFPLWVQVIKVVR